MDTRNLLDQLLKAGSDLMQTKAPDQSTNSSSAVGGIGDLISKNKGGLVAGGVLGLLLGSKTGRKIGGGALKYGSLAALGAIAYKAYNNWQEQQQGATNTTAAQPINTLPAPEIEQHSRAVLVAMIGAAKADGHIDAKERALIDQGITSLTQDTHLQAWFDQELNKPLDPVEVASHARTPEMAAEMYLASVLVVDQESFMEKAYLGELAKQLNIDATLKAELEAQVKAEH